MFFILESSAIDEGIKEVDMQKFVLAGKAKTVFEMIELMARGEREAEEREEQKRLDKLALADTVQLWPIKD